MSALITPLGKLLLMKNTQLRTHTLAAVSFGTSVIFPGPADAGPSALSGF